MAGGVSDQDYNKMLNRIEELEGRLGKYEVGGCKREVSVITKVTQLSNVHCSVFFETVILDLDAHLLVFFF